VRMRTFEIVERTAASEFPVDDAISPLMAIPPLMIISQFGDRLLSPAQVAPLFGVASRTLTRWARLGKLTAVRTVGGHRRFRESEVWRLLNQVEHGSAV
jgi:excisionase family DNA binding protein